MTVYIMVFFCTESSHITLSAYFGSPQLERLIDQLSDSPAMSRVLYQILVNVMFDPSKVLLPVHS